MAKKREAQPTREAGAEIERLQRRIVELESQLSEPGTDANDDLLDAVLETSVAAITVIDPEGNITFANPAAETILGLKPSEIVQRRYDAPEWRATALDGGEWPDEKQPFVRVMRTGKPVYDVRHAIEWPDGQRKALSINGAPIKDSKGNITRLVFSITDITLELALRSSEEAFRTVVETVPSYVLSVAPDRSIQFINRTLPHLTPEDVVGQDVVEFMTEQSRDEFAHALDQAFATGEPQELEAMALTPEGEPASFLIRMGPVKKGDVVESVTLGGVDVTQLKRAEAALLASEEQLRHSQRLESVGRLAGGVAHDFNNLLTVIVGCLDLLDSRLEGQTELLDLTQPIWDAAERGTSLTRQLLAFARQKMVQPKVLDLNEQIRKAADLLRRLIGEDVELKLELAGALWPVEIDPVQFEQVLVNLAINARDAMPSGGTLSITSENTGVRREHAPHDRNAPVGDWVAIDVSDTGVGISKETLPFVFEPFFTTKSAGEGSGLGLATCFGIVGQAGGRIRVESEPGRGTRFQVLLPRADTKPAAKIVGAGRGETREGEGTVLLVEDDAMVRQVSRAILTRAGYRLLEAENGVDALEIFRAHQGDIDIVVTDVVMPKMSGTDLVRELLAIDSKLKVLLVSGYAKDLASSEMFQRANVHLLEKPFSSEILTEKIHDILTKS